MDLLFGFSGRIGRAKWWLAELAVPVVLVAIIAVFALFVRVADPSSDHGPGELSNGGLSIALMIIASVVLAVWINAAATVKRLHDRDKPGVWFFIIFVPIIGPLWHLVECGFLPGTPGGNSYGPSPVGDQRAFTAEVDAHIANMKAQRAGRPEEERVGRREPPRTAASPVTTTSATVTRRPATPSGFGRRGV